MAHEHFLITGTFQPTKAVVLLAYARISIFMEFQFVSLKENGTHLFSVSPGFLFVCYFHRLFIHL